MNSPDRSGANLSIIADRTVNGFTNYNYPINVTANLGLLTIDNITVGGAGAEIVFMPLCDCIEENYMPIKANRDAICNIIIGQVDGTNLLVAFLGFYFHGSGLVEGGATASFCSSKKLLAGHRYKWVYSYPDKDTFRCVLLTEDDVELDRWEATDTDLTVGGPDLFIGYPQNSMLAAVYEPEGYHPPQEFKILSIRNL